MIIGIIDWGDMTAGDIATDLAATWLLFADQRARQQVFAAYHPISKAISKATVQRAQGWAILFGTVLLATGLVDNPRNATIGQKTLQRVCEDSEPRYLAFG